MTHPTNYIHEKFPFIITVNFYHEDLNFFQKLYREPRLFVNLVIEPWKDKEWQEKLEKLHNFKIGRIVIVNSHDCEEIHLACIIDSMLLFKKNNGIIIRKYARHLE